MQRLISRKFLMWLNGAKPCSVLAIARRHKLTVYHARYLELAQRGSLQLATLDKDLRKAAMAVNVRLLEPEG